jgi:TonB-dependent starch-binding outer membrane protein SusC
MIQSLRYFLVAFGLLLFGAAATGQTVALSGTVKEPNGSTLPGVSIVVKGSNTGTQTDGNGAYRLNVPANATLTFSFIGKTPQEIAVGNRTTLDVVLADDAKALNEVVVVGYGTQRRRDLTGAIASVSSEDFQKGNIVNPEQLVAGKIAGVQITSGGGAPGQGSTIRIRGGSSLNANNDPLIVIDGVALDNAGISGAANPLSFINPQDIETFTVLKDASATAIYGSRASNGVILITTKKGRAGGDLRVSVSTLGSVSVPYKYIQTVGADEFRTLVGQIGTADQKKLFGTANTDWQKQIFQNSFSSDNNVSVTGAILQKLPFRASVGYNAQNGILKTSSFNRTSLSLGLSPKFLKNALSVDVNVKTTFIGSRFADQGAIGAAIAFDPTQPVYSGNDLYGGFFEWIDPATKKPNTLATKNPLGLLEQRTDKSNVSRTISNVVLDYKLPFVPGLRANLNLALDASASSGTIQVPATAGAQFARGGSNNQYSQTKTNTTAEFYLNYVQDLRAIQSRVDVTGGYAYQDFRRKSPAYADLRADNTVVSPAGIDFETQNRLISFFGRANYSLRDRYVLTGTLRYDGSSRFSPETRWGLFPSAAAAWNIKEEGFLRDVKVLSALKIRVGYGVTGQQDVSTDKNVNVGNDYPYIARYTQSDFTSQYQFGNTFLQTYRPEGYDANIKWESTTTKNLGVDYAFLDGRISGSIELYQKDTKDLLAIIPVPAGSNLTNRILTNVGSLENKGVEFTINTNPVRTEDFTLDLGFNVTYNQNKITNLTKVPTPNDPGVLVGGISGGVGNTVQIQTVGFPTFSYYVYRQVYGLDGRPLEGVYEDRPNAEGALDGKTTVDDRYRYKSANPQAFLGFTAQATYKRFNAGFVLRANFGNYVYNNLRSNFGALRGITNSTGYLSNVSPDAVYTGFKNNQYFSDYYIENASFLRMDNLNLGYNFGKVGKKASLRASATVQNLFIVTNYTGLDPEIQDGLDNNFYPRPRIGSLGLNLDF